MKLKTCTVEIAGMACQPDESGMMQVAGNLTPPARVSCVA